MIMMITTMMSTARDESAEYRKSKFPIFVSNSDGERILIGEGIDEVFSSKYGADLMKEQRGLDGLMERSMEKVMDW